MKAKERALEGLEIARAISSDAPRTYIPPREAVKPESESILPADLLAGTRGYLGSTFFCRPMAAMSVAGMMPVQS